MAADIFQKLILELKNTLIISKLIKCADINHNNALKCAKTYKIEALTVKELLKDSEIEIILNLTIPKAHYQVAKQALTNGKHVYSEKPLAINFEDGKDLLKLAKKEKTLYW